MSLPSNSKIDKLKALVENHHNPTSYVEDVNCLCQDLGNSPYHHILPEELGLLTKLYQNIYDAMVNSDKEARYVHTNAAKSIIVVLGLMKKENLTHQMPPTLSISAVTEAVFEARPTDMAEIQKEIAVILEENKHPDSYGVVLNVGFSDNTNVPCVVFGSQTPKDFKTPRSFTRGETTIGVILRSDRMMEAACVDAKRTWRFDEVHGYESGQLNIADKIDLSGYSFGCRGDINEAGTLTCFLTDEFGNIFALGAAHTVSGIRHQCEIAVPATFETTVRFHHIHGRKSATDSAKEEYACLDYFSEPLSDQDLMNHQTCPPKKIVLPKLGTVEAFSYRDVLGVLTEHNAQLKEENSIPFRNLRHVATKVEWSCVKMDDPSRAKNSLPTSKFRNPFAPLAGIRLLSPGMLVSKTGRSTSTTKGEVNPSAVEWYTKGTITMEIGISSIDNTAFADRGDSGALVVVWDRAPYAVGILVGLNENEDIGIVTPIRAVLKDMKMQTGKEFQLMNVPDTA